MQADMNHVILFLNRVGHISAQHWLLHRLQLYGRRFYRVPDHKKSRIDLAREFGNRDNDIEATEGVLQQSDQVSKGGTASRGRVVIGIILQDRIRHSPYSWVLSPAVPTAETLSGSAKYQRQVQERNG